MLYGINVKSVVSLVLLVTGMVADYFFGDDGFWNYARIVFYMLAYLPVGIPVLKEAWENIVEKKDWCNEFMLMTIASIGAFVIGEFPEAVAVMVFYSIGESLQDRAVDNARRTISSMADMRAETAVVVRGGEHVSIKAEDIDAGDVVFVKVGERIPADGMLMDTSASFNASALTGESVPQDKCADDEVFSGMIPVSSPVCIKVSRKADDSAAARIMRMVEDASERKSSAELFIRKFAHYYTPSVVVAALLLIVCPFVYSLFADDYVYYAGQWVYRAMIFLVVSCPCALVISIPLSYFSGIGAASHNGILFKGGNFLDAAAKLNTVVFDKTGTLTTGRFTVDSIDVSGTVGEDALVGIVAGLESSSMHPIAKAVVEYAEKSGVKVSYAENVEEMAGYGVKGTVDGRVVMVGNEKMMREYGVEGIPEGGIKTNGPTLFCAVDGAYAGRIVVKDVVKDDAVNAVSELKRLGIRKIEILSGDRQDITEEIAGKIGIDEAYGNLLPGDKLAHVEKLIGDRRNSVAFVGDGINDAPVLALSDVGVAMGGIGSDMAIEAADVVIRDDKPSKLAVAIKIGRGTRRVVMENIIFAVGAKLAVIVLGALGVATMWEAIFADVGVGLIAIMNAARIQIAWRKK